MASDIRISRTRRISSLRRAAAGSQYALILGLIAIVGLLAVTQLGFNVKTLLLNVSNRLGNVGGSDGAGSGAGGGGPQSVKVIAVGVNNPPYLLFYDAANLQRIASVIAPGDMPTGPVRGFSFTNDGTKAVAAYYQAPWVSVYDTTTTPWTRLNILTSTPTVQGTGVSFNPTGTQMAISLLYSPFIAVYDTSGASWNAVAAPSISGVSFGYNVKYSPVGSTATVQFNNSPGTYFYNTATTPWTAVSPGYISATGWSTAFSPGGAKAVTVHNGGGYMAAYSVSGSSWTRLADPTNPPTGGTFGSAFTSDGNRVLVSGGSNCSPACRYVNVYDTSSAPWTRLAGVADADQPDQAGFSAKLSADGANMAVTLQGGSGLVIYRTSDWGRRTELTQPPNDYTYIAVWQP